MRLSDFVQIAGVHDVDEARLLMDCGVHYIGFPLRLPVNQEDLSEAQAAAIIRAMRPPCFGVLITYQRDADDVAGLLNELGASIVQLHGDFRREEVQKLQRLKPGLTIIKSLVIGERQERQLAATVQRLGDVVDAFITDTFDPTTGASGATGKTHDWSVSRRLVEASPRPVILAGGLTPDNVREAILTVRPAGVDSHTGVEDSSGRKSAERVRRFVAEARAGFELLRAGSAGRARHPPAG